MQEHRQPGLPRRLDDKAAEIPAFLVRRNQTEAAFLRLSGQCDSVAYVPLMVKVPGQTEGRVDDSNLMAVDVVPTIADLVGISVAWDVDGHPAGSAGIDARGDRKYAHDIVNPLFGQKLRGIIEFDARAEFPDVADRWIASIPADADKLAALNARLDLDHILGRPFAEVATPGEGGDAVVHGLRGMREQSPATWQARLLGAARRRRSSLRAVPPLSLTAEVVSGMS